MQRHLSTLSILHYVYGAFVCLSGLAALAVVLVGGILSSDLVNEAGGDGVPAFIGGIIQTLGWTVLVIVEAWGIINILSGGWIASRRNRTGTQVVAAFNCLNVPFGLALGIFTFITLGDDDVKRAYGQVPPTFH
jgi:hypothetical protein